jgi:hypothetical protein
MNLKFITNLFTKDSWETIFQKEVEVEYKYLLISRNQWKFIIVKVELNSKRVHCYLTDGLSKFDVDLNIAIMAYPELVELLKEKGIKW